MYFYDRIQLTLVISMQFKEILKNVKLMQISKLQFTYVHLTNKNSCKGNWSRRGLQFFCNAVFLRQLVCRPLWSLLQ